MAENTPESAHPRDRIVKSEETREPSMPGIIAFLVRLFRATHGPEPWCQEQALLCSKLDFVRETLAPSQPPSAEAAGEVKVAAQGYLDREYDGCPNCCWSMLYRVTDPRTAVAMFCGNARCKLWLIETALPEAAARGVEGQEGE